MSCVNCTQNCEIVKHPNQPQIFEGKVGNFFIAKIAIPKADSIVPQHSHTTDHTTLVESGAVEAWKESFYLGLFEAPAKIFIAAGVKHTFKTLKDDTVLYCIHDKEPVISEEHHLNFVGEAK